MGEQFLEFLKTDFEKFMKYNNLDSTVFGYIVFVHSTLLRE